MVFVVNFIDLEREYEKRRASQPPPHVEMFVQEVLRREALNDRASSYYRMHRAMHPEWFYDDGAPILRHFLSAEALATGVQVLPHPEKRERIINRLAGPAEARTPSIQRTSGARRKRAMRGRQQPQDLSLLYVPDAILNFATVQKITGKSRATIYRWERAGTWPQHFHPNGGSADAWVARDVLAALQAMGMPLPPRVAS